MLAGYAEVEFTPEPGLPLVGQMHERRGAYVYDPLLACAAAFRTPDSCVVIVAVDVCVLDTGFVRETQRDFSACCGVKPNALLVHATHTHLAPSPSSLLGDEGDAAFSGRLRSAIVSAGQLALSRLEPVDVFGATGRLDEMGWNRRAMFDDGTSRMYGHSKMPGFIGLEGPRDPALPLLWTRNRGGELTGILLSFSTHPNTLESECFYSADIPGAVRDELRLRLKHGIGVVYLTGAAGNTAPSILDPYVEHQPWRGEEGLWRSGRYIADEAARVMSLVGEPMDRPVLRHERSELQFAVRPWPEAGTPTHPGDVWPGAAAYYRRAENEWPARIAAGPVDVRVNVVRIGDAVICTSPGELFVEFGLAIRGASAAAVTFVPELTDGYAGYVPTPLAYSRGGYETWPAPSSQLDITAGWQIVEATRCLLRSAFPQVEVRSS